MSVIYKSLKNTPSGGQHRPRAAVSALEDEGGSRFRTLAMVVGGIVLAGVATAYGVRTLAPVAVGERSLDVDTPRVVLAASQSPGKPGSHRAGSPNDVAVVERPNRWEPDSSGDEAVTQAPARLASGEGRENDQFAVGQKVFSGATVGERPRALTRVAVSRDGAGDYGSAQVSAPVAEPVPTPKPEPKVGVVNNRVEGQRLVGDLRAAMARKDRAATEELFQRLESLRGREDTFLLKLKGFWHISNDEPREAEQALSRVLARLPDDLDANLNMALIESRTGRMDDAKYRAERLRSRYPGDQRVQELGRLFR